jgi:chromosome segregation ATPase
MCKKIGIAAIVVIAGLLVLNKTRVGEQVKRFVHSKWEKVAASVIKPEDEIKSLKDKLNDFDPKLREQINKMAEVKAESLKLEKTIAEQSARLGKQKDKILGLKEELENVRVNKSGKAYTVKAATLDAEFRSFQAGEESLKVKQDMLERSKEKFAAAEAKLAAMQAAKVKLEADLAQLEVRLEVARAREAQNDQSFEDEALGDIKEDVAKLEERITKMEIKNDLEAVYLPPTKESSAKKAPMNADNLFKEIDDHFAPGAKTGAKVASDQSKP